MELVVEAALRGLVLRFLPGNMKCKMKGTKKEKKREELVFVCLFVCTGAVGYELQQSVSVEGEGVASFAHRRGELVEDGDGVVPADACVGDADAVL